MQPVNNTPPTSRPHTPEPPDNGDADGLAGAVGGLGINPNAVPETLLQSWKLVEVDGNPPIINAIATYKSAPQDRVELEAVVNGNVATGIGTKEGDHLEFPALMTTAATPEIRTQEAMAQEAIVIHGLADSTIESNTEDELILVTNEHKLRFLPRPEERYSDLKTLKAEKEGYLSHRDYLFPTEQWEREVRHNVTQQLVEIAKEMKALAPKVSEPVADYSLNMMEGNWRLVAIDGNGLRDRVNLSLTSDGASNHLTMLRTYGDGSTRTTGTVSMEQNMLTIRDTESSRDMYHFDPETSADIAASILYFFEETDEEHSMELISRSETHLLFIDQSGRSYLVARDQEAAGAAATPTPTLRFSR